MYVAKIKRFENGWSSVLRNYDLKDLKDRESKFWFDFKNPNNSFISCTLTSVDLF